jgi:NADH-ubiquinone oxidoreductase chain 6
MFSLYYFIEVPTNGFIDYTLDILALVCIFCAILTIISKNPVVSVLFLIGLFSSIALYLILIGLVFIGISYLLVYIGAVSILFLFILMLINIRISELLSNNNNYLPLAILSVISFIYILGQLLPFNIKFNFFDNIDSQYFFIEKISLASGNNWDLNLIDISHINSIGNIMYSSYSIWLIITSIILLLGMVGSIVITIK